jgi:hypothetical protein
MEIEKSNNERRSELFTVRLWREELGDNQAEWRGKVQHVQKGEAYYFRDWSMLVAAIRKMLQEPDAPPQAD